MRPRLPRVAPLALALLAFMPTAAEARAQSALDAPPNLAGAWVAAPGVLQFNLVHRFDVSDPPIRKLNNTPTLLAALGVTRWASVGFVYGSNSELVTAYPNEWEYFGRIAPLRESDGAPLDAALQGGYNLAARSTDAALTLARSVGRVRVLGTGAFLSSAFDSGVSRWVVGGGATVRLTPGLALAGDVASLADRGAGEDITWSAGVHVGVATTPHSLSLHVTNVGTRTLQGLARGSAQPRFGFEYTIPITFRRYAHRSAAPSMESGSKPEMKAMQSEMTTAAQADTSASMLGADSVVRIDVKQLAFKAARIEVPVGTIVEWVNEDPLPHTVTADDSTFDSGLIGTGARWRRRFDAPGTFNYHCTPHPFMKGVIIVRPRGQGAQK